MFQFVPIASGLVTGHLWKEPGSIPLAPSLQVLMHIDEIPREPSLLQAEQPQLSQPVPVGQTLQALHLRCDGLVNSTVSMSLLYGVAQN